MRPGEALEAQIERYRRMTGEEGLKIALELHDLACDIARQGILAQHPGATPSEVERLLRIRIEMTRQ